MRPVWVV